MINLGIIIPCCKDGDYIDMTLESLEDQDYKDFKVIFVNDGNDKLVEKRIIEHIENKSYTFELNYEVLETKSGASRARNYGYEILMDSIGCKIEYVLFLDDDCQLNPGILQNMVDILINKPEIGFVYGDYEFEDGQKYTSRPFNPYTLRTMNYISTMSMIRAENRPYFNERLPYFQDWDLFYNLSRNGILGYYLKETIFKTKIPTEGNISAIKIPLKDKCELFRKVNNIKNSKLVVTTFGCPLQAEQRAEILDADYAGTYNGSNSGIYPINLQFNSWTHTYMVGLFNSPIQAFKNHLDVCVGRPIIHFIGTDVFQLFEKQSSASLERIRLSLQKKSAILLVNSKRLKKEMDKMNFKTELVYTPIYKPESFSLSPLPNKFTVAVYYSDSPNMNFFNTNDPHDNNNGESNIYLLWEVAKAMPHIDFKFFGGLAKFKTANVEFCGKIEDMPNFISTCSTIVRSTIHDSLPQLPIQFMLSGRRVITSSNFTFGDVGLSFGDILDFEKCKTELINKIKEVKILGILKTEEQNKVYDFVNNNLSKDKYIKSIKRIIEIE